MRHSSAIPINTDGIMWPPVLKFFTVIPLILKSQARCVHSTDIASTSLNELYICSYVFWVAIYSWYVVTIRKPVSASCKIWSTHIFTVQNTDEANPAHFAFLSHHVSPWLWCYKHEWRQTISRLPGLSSLHQSWQEPFHLQQSKSEINFSSRFDLQTCIHTGDYVLH